MLARDTTTGREKIVPIQSAVDVSDDHVQEMVEESVENAFEDMDALLGGGGARAREAVKAAHDGLEAFRDELDNAQIIDEAITAVEGLLQSADNIRRFVGAQGSRGVVGSGTRLADLMMDRAMEAMLRKQGVLTNFRCRRIQVSNGVLRFFPSLPRNPLMKRRRAVLHLSASSLMRIFSALISRERLTSASMPRPARRGATSDLPRLRALIIGSHRTRYPVFFRPRKRRWIFTFMPGKGSWREPA